MVMAVDGSEIRMEKKIERLEWIMVFNIGITLFNIWFLLFLAVG